jgi:GTPase SAR1 family protein
MISLSKGREIGIINKGKYRGQKIGILTEEEFKKKCCKNRNDDCKYSECCENCTYDKMDSENMILNNSNITPLPNKEIREVTYIAGPSGVGKSTLASEYIKEYKKMYPTNEIIIFSRKPNDKVLDKLQPLRFIIDESIVTDPIDVLNEEEFKKGCLVLFDDCNTFQNDKIKKAVSKLMNDILEIGRSYNIYCIITSHLLNQNEKKDSRTIWNEAHNVVIFPKGGNRYGIEYALKNYCGFDKKIIAEIFKLNSRWCLICKQFPNYILHQNGCFIPK